MKTREYLLTINGLPVNALFYDEDIRQIFLPLLRKFAGMARQKGRRLIVFLAAAPGTGKSTLVSFLERLSNDRPDLAPLQSIGVDGFHYPNDYLKTHHISGDPSRSWLYSIKGAPETFDVEKLERYLACLCDFDLVWPKYSRTIHDVDPHGCFVYRNIVLLEGNYLLLDRGPWSRLKKYADYSIFLTGDEEAQKEHLIRRKQAGGSSLKEATDHYYSTDERNVDLVNHHSVCPDLMLSSDRNMKYSIVDLELPPNTRSGPR